MKFFNKINLGTTGTAEERTPNKFGKEKSTSKRERKRIQGPTGKVRKGRKSQKRRIEKVTSISCIFMNFRFRGRKDSLNIAKKRFTNIYSRAVIIYLTLTLIIIVYSL